MSAIADLRHAVEAWRCRFFGHMWTRTIAYEATVDGIPLSAGNPDWPQNLAMARFACHRCGVAVIQPFPADLRPPDEPDPRRRWVR